MLLCKSIAQICWNLLPSIAENLYYPVTTLFTAVMAGRRVLVFPSPVELGPVLAHLVTSRAEKAIASRGRFTLGLSGGSLVSMLSKELLTLPNLDCSKWVVGFCDERLVPFDDPESTYGLYKVPSHLLISVFVCIRVTLMYCFCCIAVKCKVTFLSFPEPLFFQGQHSCHWDLNYRFLSASKQVCWGLWTQTEGGVTSLAVNKTVFVIK